MPMFAQLLMVLVVAFVALVIALRWLMSQHATTTIAHLQGLSQEYMKKQDEVKKRLDESERQYQEQLAKAQEDVRQLKAQAGKDAEGARQQLLEQAHKEAERIVQQAIQARETMQQEMGALIETRAVEKACELLCSSLPEALRAAAHAQWVDALLANGLIPDEQLRIQGTLQQVKIVSAFPLTAAQRKELAQRLQAATGRALTLEETVDLHLVAGIVITLGHTVLDGSLATQLQKVTRHAQSRSS